MSSYQKEQIDALSMVHQYLASVFPAERRELESLVADYLLFRKDIDIFCPNILAVHALKAAIKAISALAVHVKESLLFLLTWLLISWFLKKMRSKYFLKYFKDPIMILNAFILGSKGAFGGLNRLSVRCFFVSPQRKRYF